MSTNLSGTFQDAENFFNAEDWNHQKPLLHDDVIMFMVDDTQPPLIGKTDVMNYLNTKGTADKPQFSHLPSGPPLVSPPSPLPSKSTVHQKGANGVIRGPANWKDKKTDLNSRPIKYVFVFSQNPPPNSDWMIRFLKGWLSP
jgi:hypothetical protein